MRGTITTTVRGSHVNITVRLVRFGRVLNYTLMFMAAFGLLIMAESILATITSGRAQQILQQQRQDKYGCSRFGDPVRVGECVIAASKGGR